MEKNNFNKAYIYIIAIFAIGIAISNIISFFNGVGFALIGASLLLILTISTILKDEEHKKRFGDIFVLITLELIMLIVLFFAYDFNLNGISSKFPLVMRNICAIYSLIATGYIVFRYVSEVKGKKYNFIEYMLGNYTPVAKSKEKKVKLSKEQIKKNKELENGTFEPKPSSLDSATNMQAENQTNDVDDLLKNVENDVAENNETASNQDILDNKSIEEKVEEIKQNEGVDNKQNSVSSVNNRTNFWY
ncbi:MAG: hypothetical protein IJ458_02355 [Clostridia bacterium]|nr:hypothetical protein [Clostridia bacterium]